MTREQIYPLYVTRFASAFGTVAVLTLLPTFIDMFSPSGLMIGLFTAALPAARTIGVIPLGWAGDRYDKRTLLLGALGISAVAYASFPFVASSEQFLLSRTLQGVGVLGTSLLGISLLGELVPADKRARRIGTYNAWRLVAGVIGTIGVGLVYERFGFDVVFGFLSVLLGVALVGVVLFIEPDQTRTPSFAFTELALNPQVLAASVFRLQHSVAVTLGRNWVPIFVGVSVASGGLGLSATMVGIVIAAEKLSNMACQPLAGRLSDHHGRELFLALSGIGYGCVLFTLPFAPHLGVVLALPETYPILGAVSTAFLPIVVINAALGAVDGLREPASMALYADEGEGEGITSSFGVRSLAWRPGSVAAPLIGGYLMTEVGMEWVFFFAGAAALSAVAVFLGVVFRLYSGRTLLRG